LPDSVNFLFVHDFVNFFSDFDGSADLFGDFLISVHKLQFPPLDFLHVDIPRLFILNFLLDPIKILFLLMNSLIELIGSVGHLPELVMFLKIIFILAELVESIDVVTVFGKGF
jgi:hypothetical protein